MATAITYQSGLRRSDLRTVLVEDVRGVKLVTGGELVLGKLVHGSHECGHRFWNDVLGTSGDDFAVERDKVRQVREFRIAVKATHK
jgi:hypothetical protein